MKELWQAMLNIALLLILKAFKCIGEPVKQKAEQLLALVTNLQLPSLLSSTSAEIYQSAIRPQPRSSQQFGNQQEWILDKVRQLSMRIDKPQLAN